MPVEDIRGAWLTKLTGVGFSYYRSETRLMEDDTLIRGRVCASFDAMLVKLRGLESAFRSRHLPPPSREKPFADPGRLAELRQIVAFREQLAALEVRVRNAAMPPADGTWNRHRDHEATLARLAEADVRLVGEAAEMEQAVGRLAAGDLPEAIEGEGSSGIRLGVYVDQLSQAIKAREDILAFRKLPA